MFYVQGIRLVSTVVCRKYTWEKSSRNILQHVLNTMKVFIFNASHDVVLNATEVALVPKPNRLLLLAEPNKVFVVPEHNQVVFFA